MYIFVYTFGYTNSYEVQDVRGLGFGTKERISEPPLSIPSRAAGHQSNTSAAFVFLETGNLSVWDTLKPKP